MRKASVIAAILTLWTVMPVLAASPTTYDPYAVGNTWEYRTEMVTVFSTGEGEGSKSGFVNTTGTMTTEIVSEKERRPDGDVVYLVRNTDRSKDDIPESVEEEQVYESLDMVSKKAILTLAERSVEENDGRWEEYNPPLNDHPTELTAGTKWSVGTTRQDTLKFKDDGRVVGRETVETPAGRFEDCVKVLIIHTKVTGTMKMDESKVFTIKSGKGIMTLWLAPGVGMVRQEEVAQLIFNAPNQSGGRTLTITMKDTKELLPGYRVQ